MSSHRVITGMHIYETYSTGYITKISTRKDSSSPWDVIFVADNSFEQGYPSLYKKNSFCVSSELSITVIS
jgi:hypothetical protein